MTDIRVSVVIPCYNTGHYLAEAISSALDQTQRALEIIVIDDGSTDETRRVVESFRDSGVIYHYQDNQGLPNARNAGARLAKGNYLAFLDADDLFMRDKLEVQTQFLERNPSIGLVAAHFIRVGKDGVPLNRPPRLALPGGEVSLAEIVVACPFATHATLLSKQWFDRVGGYEDSLVAAEDWDLYVRLAIAGCRMHKLERSVCSYRYSPTSMSLQGSRQTEAMLQVIDRTFANPELPPALRSLETSARTDTCLKGMARCYATGDVEPAKRYLEEALELLSSVGRVDPDLVAEHLQRMISYTKIDDPAGYYREVLDNLPSGSPAVKRVRRALLVLLLELQVRVGLAERSPGRLLAALWAYASRAPLRCATRVLLAPLRRISHGRAMHETRHALATRAAKRSS